MYMKTLLLLIVICCGSEKEGTYVYEAKNLATNEVGKLYSGVKYNVGDTLTIQMK